MANKPNNPSLWSKAKSLARQKFDVYPSAYANGWAAKWYKGKGGTWRKAQFGMEINNKDISIPSLPVYAQGGEPDGGMALQQMSAVIDKLSKLRKFIKPNTDLEPWISSKLAVMDHYADAVSDYMTYGNEYQDGGDMVDEYSPNLPQMRMAGVLPKYQGRSGSGNINESVGADAQKIGKCGLEGSSKGSGCDPLIDRPATKQELYPTKYSTLYSELPSDKKERRAFIQSFEQLRGSNPSLAGYRPEDYAAAVYEANIYNNYFGEGRQGKYYNPETGMLLPGMESSARPNSAAAYYRTKFPKADKISPEQIIGLMPLEQRKALIAAGYKQKKGGSLPGMQRGGWLDEYKTKY